ncbi:hypothetical protein RJ498_003075 [Pluralibacter gergoviae]
MFNYYEYLKLDMTATSEEIAAAINEGMKKDDNNAQTLREIKSILLTESSKKVYDEKLVASILNKEKLSGHFDIKSLKGIINIDNSGLHDKYIWIATGIFSIGILASFLFGMIVSYTVNIFVMIALIIFFYLDWRLLQKHNKATFSKWWILFSPVYIAKRCKAVGKGQTLLLVWLSIWVIYFIGNFAFNSTKAMLERSACEVVTDIYHKQLRQYSQKCENVTLTESEGKRHFGFAELSDGSNKDITVTEQSDGRILVYIN